MNQSATSRIVNAEVIPDDAGGPFAHVIPAAAKAYGAALEDALRDCITAMNPNLELPTGAEELEREYLEEYDLLHTEIVSAFLQYNGRGVLALVPKASATRVKRDVWAAAMIHVLLTFDSPVTDVTRATVTYQRTPVRVMFGRPPEGATVDDLLSLIVGARVTAQEREWRPAPA